MTLLNQAMLHDPLVGAVCDPEDVWQMTDEILVTQAEWLPQYARKIPAVKSRPDAAAKGTRVKTMEGFADRRVCTAKTFQFNVL